jgi:SRSO17 transposase
MLCVVLDLVAGKLDRLHERIAGRFARAEPRARVRRYVSGLVTGLERKNGWTLAEQAGEVSPDGMQRLLRRADWDVDGVRDDVRGYVAENIGDPGGVLIAEECFQQAKGEAGLDHYQVRSWRAWYSHITLSMLALAWLAVTRARAVKGEPEPATRA